MTKIRRAVAIVAVAALTAVAVFPVFAASANYTGWSMEAGRPVYYENGAKVTDSWVSYGDVYYYVGSDGQVIPERVVAKGAAAEVGIVAKEAATAVQYDVTGNTQADAPAATPATTYTTQMTDYDAFKTLHPDVVAAYGADEAGLKNYYLATYGGVDSAANRHYLDCIARYEYSLYNTHHYTAYFENQFDGTHKAYCVCGEWIIEGCSMDGERNDGKHRYVKCTRCGYQER